MHWSEFIMMIGIIIISTYVSLKVINDIKQFINKWTVVRSNIYKELLVDSRHKEELTEDLIKLTQELSLERQ